MRNTGWHSEKHELCNILQERVLEGRKQITYSELIEKNLPGFFRSFLKSQIKRYFDQENPVKIEKNSRYDLHFDEIQQELGRLKEAIQQSTLFTADEISDAIDKTVSLQIDYFVKPRTILERVFYKSKESRSQKEILQAILGISDNRIYIQELIKKIKSNSTANISKSEFARLAREVETFVYQQDTISVFLQDVSVLLEFLSIIHNQTITTLKVNLLPEMLLARNLNKLTELAQSNASEKAYTLKQIEELLQTTPETFPFKNNGRDNKKKKNFPSSDWQEEIFYNDKTDMHPFLDFSEKSEQPDEPAEKKKTTAKTGNKVFFASGRSQTIGAREIESLNRKEKETPKVKKPKIIYKGEEKNFPSKTGLHGRHADEPENMMIDRKMIENQPEGPIPSLSKIIDSRSRKILIRKIFKKNEVAYNEFMEKMEATLTWKEAKVMIDEELLKRNVEPFSREAIRLGDLIFSRYFPKKR